MSTDQIKAQVKDFIVENFLLGTGGDEIANDTSFLENDLLNSTDVLELIAFLEETFDISVADEETLPENLDSLTQIEAYVQRKRAG